MKTKKLDIDELEKAINEKWGKGPYRWRIGSRSNGGWIWSCNPINITSWLHQGYAPTLKEALYCILNAEKL